VSFVGTAVFILAVAALHGLRADLDPVQHTISEYSLGKFGWLMRAAFGALGISVIATAESVRERFEPTAWRNIGLLFLIGTAAGLILDAAYNTDHLRVPETFDGSVHGDGMFIVCLTLPTAALILGTDFARPTLPLPLARWLQVLAVAQGVAVIAFATSPIAYRGLTERVAVTFGIASLAALQACARDPATEWKAAELMALGVEAVQVQFVGTEYRSEEISSSSGYGAID
jgi:hypothetical protein